MKPQSIGRILGIGLRVAGRVAGERLSAHAQAAANAPVRQPDAYSPAQSRAAGQAAGQATKGIARGVGGFLRPFGRVGGILWLEVTGVFFLLFAVVFGSAAWRNRPGTLYGPFDRAFAVSAGAMLVFLYLSVSSFLRARKK
jgi:hypothetical protein